MDKLITTGAFSEATMLSTKALRLYAERGLLPPARVDPANGYRYYETSQTRTGRLIGLLRAADVPLSNVAAVIAASPDEATARVAALKAGLRSRSANAEALLDKVAARLGAAGAVTDGASLDWVESTPALSVSGRVAADELDAHAERVLERLRHAAEHAGATAVADAICVFHGPVNVESDGPVEVLLPVDALVPVPEGMRALRTQGGWFAHLPARGAATSYPQVLAVYDALATWCERRGHELAGPPRGHCCVERSRAPGAANLPVRADGDRPNRANTTHLSRTGRPFGRLVRQSTGRSPATRRGRPLMQQCPFPRLS